MRKFLCFAILMYVSSAAAQTPAASFDFHSGFWVNLHHFLYEQAMSRSPLPSDSPDWQRALAYYKSEMTPHDMLSREMEAVNNTLGDLEAAKSLNGSGLDARLIAVLEGAAPEYRKRWWAEHDRANGAWIAAVQPLLAKYGGAVSRALAMAYGADWQKTPIRTDVAEYANWAGAYTTLYPTHITVSSAAPANAGNAALEILFHEGSHALIGGVQSAISQEARAQGKLLRKRDLWHAVLFYTAGQMVAGQLPGYTPYAIQNGLYNRGWSGLLPVLDQDWKPYLDGKVDRASAIRRLVSDYSEAPRQESNK